MAFVWLGIFAFFGYFGWWLLVPIVGLGLLWDATSVTGRVRGWWQQKKNQRTAREWELGNAGRGAGLLALLVLGGWLVGGPPIGEFLTAARAGDWEHGGAVLAVGMVAAAALLMFLTGANKALQSAGQRETRLIAWALVRLGLGAALWWEFNHPAADWAQWVMLARARLPYCDIAVMVMALWLAVTGATKLLLILWGGNSAEAIIRRILRRRNAPLVPARRLWWWPL